MDVVHEYVKPVKEFAKDSMRLVKRCTKPDLKGKRIGFHTFVTVSTNLPAEFQKIALATALGFAIMGFIGFFVKLIHIPINNIIV